MISLGKSLNNGRVLIGEFRRLHLTLCDTHISLLTVSNTPFQRETTCSSISKWLRIFTNSLPVLDYKQKEIKPTLEQYLKLDPRPDSVNYHCVIFWSSWMLIIWLDKSIASLKYNFHNFHLDDQNHWFLLMFLNNNHWLLSEKLSLNLLNFTATLIHYFTLITYISTNTNIGNFISYTYA